MTTVTRRTDINGTIPVGWDFHVSTSPCSESNIVFNRSIAGLSEEKNILAALVDHLERLGISDSGNDNNNEEKGKSHLNVI